MIPPRSLSAPWPTDGDGAGRRGGGRERTWWGTWRRAPSCCAIRCPSCPRYPLPFSASHSLQSGIQKLSTSAPHPHPRKVSARTRPPVRRPAAACSTLLSSAHSPCALRRRCGRRVSAGTHGRSAPEGHPARALTTAAAAAAATTPVRAGPRARAPIHFQLSIAGRVAGTGAVAGDDAGRG
jgi:hypothetical protein